MPEIEEVTAAPAPAEAPKKQSNVEKQLAAMRAAMAADAEKQRIEDAKPKGKAVPGRYDEQGYSVPESLKNVTTDEDGYGVFPEDDEFNEEGAKEFVDPRWEMSMQQLRDSYVETLKGRDDKGFASADLKGEVSLVNIFGSWCVACRVEHPFLMKIKENGWVPVHGIDWREPDRDAGPTWLKRHGDPYTLAGDDPKSKAAIAFGVTGAPETFVVDKLGVIRYKHVGPIDDQVWSETLKPLIDHLRGQGG